MEPDRAIEIVQSLADGVDPYSGERFASDSPYQQADLSGQVGGGAGGIGGILASTQASAPAYYHYDFNGNVVQVSSSNQTQLAKYTYSPFGEVLLKDGAFTSRYQFSSKEYDASTGLNYYGYRFYSPELGRWVSRDPIREAERFIDLMNLYRFGMGDPMNKVDALGLQTCSDIRDCSPIPPPNEYTPLIFSNGGCFCLWWGGKQEPFDEYLGPNYAEVDCGKCKGKAIVTTYIRRMGTRYVGTVEQVRGGPPCRNYKIGDKCKGEMNVRVFCITHGGCNCK